uniref:Bromodomain adjacent to zinc finger domain protein 2B n=1 Tax=Romanomermis culicivorax TaxID=13658 RepID=A0A915JG42_ROMCU
MDNKFPTKTTRVLTTTPSFHQIRRWIRGDSHNLTDARKRWQEALKSAKSAAQFSLCLDFLDENICWDRSAMKAMCQICRRGDNDSQLLLCDGCDLGYHTYCFKPEMSSIPDTDWFCPECVSQATRRPCCLLCCRQTSRPMITCCECDRRFHCDCASHYKKLEPNQKNWLCQGCESLSKDKESNNNRNKRLRKISQKDSADVNNRENKSRKTKMKCRRRSNVELNSKNDSLHFTEICRILIADLDTHKDGWPFKSAVDPKTCPLYSKIIKKPMDLSLIQEKLTTNKYTNAHDFVADIKLMFNNCKIFNEDDSAIGKSGRSLKKFFAKRWRELNEISSVDFL